MQQPSPILDTRPTPAGRRDHCRAPECGAEIWWTMTARGKYTPVNRDGSAHWGTCPAARNFKKLPRQAVAGK